MKFIDLFSGVGGFTRGLELAGHECIGHCELDKFAEASYRSMHTITEEQRKYLLSLPLKKRQKEILKEEYLNGEWYESDITKARNIPKADIWTFGAPCQDFSIAGRRAGLDGGRSSLVREVFRLLGERQKEDRPEWVIYENVKGMLSSNRGGDYLEILASLDELGYDVEWQNINSKWFVPQNRERIYTIGHLRGRGGCKIFPIKGASGENHLKQLVQGSQGNRVYNSDGISCTLSSLGGGQGAKTGLYAFGIEKSRNNPKPLNIANCIRAKEDSGVSNRKSEGTAVVIPVLTPDRISKRQNGRRFKDDGDPMFTLTTQDRHGVGINVKEATKAGYKTAYLGDSVNLAVPASKTRRGRVGRGTAQILDTSCNQGVVVNNRGAQHSNKADESEMIPRVVGGIGEKNSNNGTQYFYQNRIYDTKIATAVSSSLQTNYIDHAFRIRKLTPKECFRLQGWSDEYFEKAKQFNSDSQLYKQAGNGVTVDVVKAIGEKLREQENE